MNDATCIFHYPVISGIGTGPLTIEDPDSLNSLHIKIGTKMVKLGVSDSQFFSSHFEKCILYRKQALGATGYDWSNVERMLYQWAPDDQKLSVHLNGLLPPGAYLDTAQDLDDIRQRINAKRLRELLTAGATLVMNRVDDKCPIIGSICAELCQLVGEKVVANGYAAFGGTGTFGKPLGYTRCVCSAANRPQALEGL
ncbi:hypothetical protein [Pseudoduganella chitinolytica]|uniref:Uncharacterized protein n=1 Tax=Pseudoduganella chitinolytica TaxID=34070 RepID=A0ABY8BHQ5_9BURK|nr:hypothetical protein [Pseudoduganella chitinolytica]WEF35201.1 hypothetical protein PX653_10715 [Pseudoduganella chitinolytica]